MRKTGTFISATLMCITLVGCGDVTVNQPPRTVIVEEKKSAPIVIEKTTVERPVIVEKKIVERPIIVEKTTEKPTIIIEKH